MSTRQRKTARRRATGTLATTQDPPDNCVALQTGSSLPNHHGKLDRSSASAPRRLKALKIVYKDPNQLKPRRSNPRTHDKNQIRQIEAAKLLGMTDLPTVRVDHFTRAQLRAYVIADNRLAELAGWNPSLLALEFQELSVELNFDVTLTGFETAEVDLLINELNGGTQYEADNVPPVDRSAAAVTRQGDFWRIGNHVLCCGDALSSTSYSRLLGKRKAQLVFIDPPYNVQISGNVSGLGKIRHREFAMASGEMTSQEYTNFLRTVFTHLAAFSADGSIHYICNDWRHDGEVLQAASTIYSQQKNLCVWSKTNAGMGKSLPVTA